MDGVPLKMPQAVSQEVKEDVKVIITDYLNILQDTEYDFCLENWVLTGLQSGVTSHRPQLSSSSSGLLPSCPPYWMMFSSTQQSCVANRHSSDFWEPNPRQRSHSLNADIMCTKFTILDSENEGESMAQNAKTCVSMTVYPNGAASRQRGQQKAFIADLLNPPACLSSLPHQRRKNLRQCSLSVLEMSSQLDPNEDNQHSLFSHRILHTKTPNTRVSNSAITIRVPNNRANTVQMLPSITNYSTMKSPNPDSCVNPPVTSNPRGLPSSGSDSSAELLSVLSPEERELLGTITAQGYPVHTAIIALQRTGRQSPDQILSYLVACDHLCQLGYDMAEVEEALEMFQNCETKAEEFLHLLSQFNEMGFQQNTIKEVLLVHENHRERALEELMMRVA
ncbi:ubiquitin-associated protein 1-like [Hippoglossus hippoglossus]|uniref:ubiquitin-associated protein 1-like n=1 Tax=Hippoglossus hippoglossus TaxID=8267 RepID=UPI00148C53BF|nr:ubiquitin-associated protein 1-like [Hippoglossus hippoglossus]XP_034437447.1 ubiquitin-associated protein 1-like [Hippoglossus hippoglossus]